MSPAKLTYNPSDWSHKQTVAVTAKADADGEDEEVKGEHTAQGSQEFKGNKAEFTVKVLDNDEFGMRLEPHCFQVLEAAQSRPPFYTVSLDVQPRRDVIVTVESSDPSAAIPLPDRLEFSTDNWNLKQSVHVSAQAVTVSTSEDAHKEDSGVEATLEPADTTHPAVSPLQRHLP